MRAAAMAAGVRYLRGRNATAVTVYVEAVVAGEIARETQTPPYFGVKAMQSCKDILSGAQVPAQQQVDIKVFDADKKDEAQQYIDSIKAQGLEF